MRKLLLFIFFILLLLTNCGKDILLNFEKHQRGENPYDPMGPETPSDETDGSWVFMVYLDADNNLEDAGISDFREITSVELSSYSGADITFIILMDRAIGYSTSDCAGEGDWTGTHIYKYDKNGLQRLKDVTINGVTLTNVGDTKELNMGDSKTLEDFIKYCINTYSATYYLLDLWNHGGGWRDNPRTVKYLPRKAICWDEGSNNDTLYIDDVQHAISSALSSAGKSRLDVIYMDACLMQMVEVAYELRNLTKYLVASEETVPGDGGDYTDILDRYKNLDVHSPFMFSYEIVASYRHQYYATSGTTLSALNLTKLNSLISAINVFADNLVKQNGSKIEDIRSETRDFTYPDQADLYHFAQLCNEKISGGVPGAEEVMVAIENMIVKEYHHSSSMAGSYGIAIYLPPSPSKVISEYTENHHSVDFISDTKWNNFIKWYENQ